VRRALALVCAALLAACGALIGADEDPGPPAISASDAGADVVESGDDASHVADAHPDSEASDAGGAPDSPSSDSGGPDAALVVFTTSIMYDGALGLSAGGDDKCQSAARASGLAGDFIAYLVTTSSSARNVLPTNGVWRRVDGPIAFIGLPDKATSKVPLNVDETGATIAAGSGWIGDTSGGTDGTCLAWDSNSAVGFGAGYLLDWSGTFVDFCSMQHHLFCFQKN
jgi:hypothetical protein